MTKQAAAYLAKQYENLDPDVLAIIIKDQVADATRQLEQQSKTAKSRAAAITEKTEDELTEIVAGYNPRTSDPQAHSDAMTALRIRQQVNVELANQTSMTAADYVVRDSRRGELVAEDIELRKLPSKGKGGRPSASAVRRKAINTELKSLMDEPDIVIPEPTSEPE